MFGRMKDFLARAGAGGGGAGGYEVLALPTVQVAAFPVEIEWVTEIDGQPQATYLDWMRSCSRITVTAHPSVSVPAGFTESGLPVGLQLVGAYGADLRLLAVAKAVSAVLNPDGAIRPELG